MAKARLPLVYLPAALVVVLAWARLERPESGALPALGLAALALLPALARTTLVRAVVSVVVAVAGASLALGAWPIHPGRLVSHLGDGTLEFYDVVLPFDPGVHPRMAQAVLFAAFVFCLAIALGLASRRVLPALAPLVLGAGWPATLLKGPGQLVLGTMILGASLVLLVGMRPKSGRGVVSAGVAGGLVLACAAALASSSAVAKGELVRWESWQLSTAKDNPVSVSFVWNSSYSGLHWPKKRTTVLRISAPDRALYWRSTTLDAFVGGRWIEDLTPVFPSLLADGRAQLTNDSLLPRAARRPANWVEQRVTVDALDDNHLVGADVPVAYAPGEIDSVSYARGGTALVVPGSSRGKTYTVWSYVDRPTPRQLARSRADYPLPISIGRGLYVSPFGATGRNAAVTATLAAREPAYLPVYQEAKRVVGKARNPYAAVVGLESWFRDGGHFRYDEQPPSVPGVPPLVAFVTETHRGYCQHFAGAMALMLRYLGIPARVAAGFTSGTYKDGAWNVTDHDAHTWVEVWFRGYGWLPFDPTPGRGRLDASYTASSPSFNPKAAAGLLGGALHSLFENRARAQDIAAARGEHARSVIVDTGGHHHKLRVVGLFLLVLAALGLGLYLTKLTRRRLRYLTRDPRRIAAACHRDLLEFVLDQRLPVASSATFGELGRAVGSEFAVPADPFVGAAGAARFGAPDRAAEAAERAKAELRELFRVLRRRLSTTERFVGALSLRSLRGV